MKKYLITGDSVEITNGPSKFDLMVSLFDNKIVMITTKDNRVLSVMFMCYLGSTSNGFKDDKENRYMIKIVGSENFWSEDRIIYFNSKTRKGRIGEAGDSQNILTFKQTA